MAVLRTPGAGHLLDAGWELGPGALVLLPLAFLAVVAAAAVAAYVTMNYGAWLHDWLD